GVEPGVGKIEGLGRTEDCVAVVAAARRAGRAGVGCIVLGRGEDEAKVDAGVRRIHVDVMDGHFVPNLSMGPLVVAALRPLAERAGAVLEVHLMIAVPDRFLDAFSQAGATAMTVRVEACPHLHRTVHAIRRLAAQPGVALNPATPLAALEEILPDVNVVLVMSVDPGFGGRRSSPGRSTRWRGCGPSSSGAASSTSRSKSTAAWAPRTSERSRTPA